MFAEQRATEVAVRAGRWEGRGGRQAGRQVLLGAGKTPSGGYFYQAQVSHGDGGEPQGFQFSPEYHEDLSETFFFSLDMYRNQAGIRVYSRHT